MTLAVSVVLFAALMLYCGVKGRSLQHAIVGRSVEGGSGSLLGGGGSTGSSSAPSSASSSSSDASGAPTARTQRVQ